ncbi:MAG: MaoC family dehydratase [Devosia sp.]
MADRGGNSPAWADTINGMPAIGATAERSRRVTMDDVVAFSAMTGDHNPLHYDAKLAAKTVFGGLIVQGGVTSGILNAIVAEDLPGPGTVFLGVEWKFIKAVPVGEEITGRVEVVKCREDKPICTLETSVRNSAGELCLSGTATTYTVPLRGLGGSAEKTAEPLPSNVDSPGIPG